MIRNLNFLVSSLIWLTIFSSCKDRYYKDYVEITVVTEIADCEKWNIFSKIIEINNPDYIEFKNDYILINCNNNTKCENILYNIEHFDTTRVFKLKGFLSKEVHGIEDYGCPSAHSFKADFVEELKLLNNENPR